jgi:uncharacterized surface anchored protein
VLGESAGGATPPASATAAKPAAANTKHGSLPFTGTDLLVILLAGVIALTAGLALRRLART